MFETVEPVQIKRKRNEIYKNLTADYFGFRDEEDGELAKKEAEREKVLIEAALKDFSERKKRKIEKREEKAEEVSEEVESSEEEHQFLSHVVVPSKEEIEAMILQKRKQELLKMYASEDLIEEMKKGEKKVKAVLGFEKK